MKIPSKVDETTFVTRNPDVAWRILGKYLIAITPSDNKVHRCNATGAFIWKCLGKDGKSLGEIRKKIEEAFDVGRRSPKTELPAFILEIAEKGLVLIE
jgi:hypothetical protein